MRANPGGEIAPEDAVGRDRFITRVWEVLEAQSVVMVAERRIGKTTVVKKMRSEPPADLMLIYRDVEGLRTPLEFAEAVAKDVQRHLTGFGTKLSKLLTHLSGAEIVGILKFPLEMTQHWKSLLEATIEDLFESHPETTWVFVWDELTLMLQKIRHNADEQAAMDVLDTLRGLRQSHSGLRMVYTGSIGLHHVVCGLNTAGPSNDPTNDMRTMEVTELSPEDGKELALALIAGEKLGCPDPAATAEAITASVDHIAYYVHHVVSRMKDMGDEASAELAASIVEEALVGANDEWHLRHYRQRLEQYYDADRLALVLRLLDELSEAKKPLAFKELVKRLRSTIPRERSTSHVVKAVLDGDDEPLHLLLDLLERDHYLRREPGTGRHSFRFPLIQRWWKLHRK